MRQSITYGLHRRSEHHGHARRRNEDELNVRELGHVLQDPLRAQLDDAVQEIVSRSEHRQEILGDRPIWRPVRTGRCVA